LLLLQVPRLAWGSVVAGLDVARRALSPAMPLATGMVACPVALPRGVGRTTFATVTSLLPGTVPAGERDDALDYHVLDVGQPVLEDLHDEERRLDSVLRPRTPS
jgi:multicomponent Na+:H+ antiporter subunit E